MQFVALDSIRTDGGTQPRVGTVYAMRRGSLAGPIKFGFTAGDVFARAAQLQTGSPEQILPMSWVAGTMEDERALHQHFADFQMVGEWFFPARKVLIAAQDLETFIGTLREVALPFRLHAAYAVDLDGRRIVNTYDMTRIEACRALAIRREQIEADQKSANDLERAIRAAEPFWDETPGLTFGEALTQAALNKPPSKQEAA